MSSTLLLATSCGICHMTGFMPVTDVAGTYSHVTDSGVFARK
ncbi:hypothetical protein AS9A_0916 [Hoyosella subflava DQS3-9A1]|uniref:Uncharacterized protein n=1 Tax=Hoyosella subflava (strain DSM 45089 / JCM 17490 / NBRC 109087 / DQS3-9A1) TaxID=443218 RepID=F6EN51_HOYSD|nr:hypothetical protein AS9A_0916 [Hoyosella subflava DQS3-9A1]